MLTLIVALAVASMVAGAPTGISGDEGLLSCKYWYEQSKLECEG
jgi:hypothetical protein